MNLKEWFDECGMLNGYDLHRKYRGKVADLKDEWVYGKLQKHGNYYVIAQDQEHEGSKFCGKGTFSVITETIGVETPFKDKNGKRIYIGDVVKEPQGDYNIIGVVGWCKPSCGYEVAINERRSYLFECFNEKNLEVLGNIIDSPELVELFEDAFTDCE